MSNVGSHLKHIMHTPKKLLALLFCFTLVGVTFAGPYTDKLSTCFSGNNSGKDRKQFARLMFVSMAAHPEMRDLAGPLKDAKEEASREVGKMVTRLLAENCTAQAKAVIKNEGGGSFQESFGVLGQLAMQELMSSKEVSIAIGSFENYIDKTKVQNALVEK